MKLCVINQPAGIGDVFFCQKIGQHFVHQGYQVKWPVRKEFLWYNDYLISPGVEFVPLGQPDNIDLYVDLQNADQIIPGPIMEGKYKLVGLDHRDWTNYFNFKRFPKKENELYYKILGLKDNERYVFRNIHYGTPPHSKCFPIPITTNLRIIDNTLYEGFNVIDWSKVIENAEEIQLIDTVFNYIMEKLTLKAKKIDLFSRWGPKNYYHLKDLFKVNYNYR